MVRTQLFLSEAIHARLRLLARRQGRTVSDLAREALERAYGDPMTEERQRTLRAIEGLWQGRSDPGSTSAYVRGLRRGTRRTKPAPR
ncbi:MAG: CopG family transcriptional regulator [Candidatus Eisenbacteria bacterium]